MAYRKNQATEDRKEARRGVVLDAATKLFGVHGYHATTVPMIVAEAEVSTGSFYMYFRNKEDVFNSALEQLGRTIARLMGEMKDSQPDALKSISQGAETLFMFLAENPEQARILIVESSGLSPRLDKTRRAIVQQQEEEVRKTLKSAPSKFSVSNTVVAARCIAGATFEAVYRWLEEDPETRMPATEVAQAVAKFNTQAVTRVPGQRK